LLRSRVKEFRARHNLTQEDLAKTVGVRRETILAIEKEKYSPSLELAHRIAKALKTSLDELYIFEEDEDK